MKRFFSLFAAVFLAWNLGFCGRGHSCCPGAQGPAKVVQEQSLPNCHGTSGPTADHENTPPAKELCRCAGHAKDMASAAAPSVHAPLFADVFAVSGISPFIQDDRRFVKPTSTCLSPPGFESPSFSSRAPPFLSFPA